MLLKCFRHDFKALSRTLVPVLIAIGAAAVFGFLNSMLAVGTLRGMDEPGTFQSILLTSSFGTLLIVGMLLAAAFTVFAVLIFVRFYRSMVTDEAYLTFTLPVSASKLIGAKFLSSAVWMILGSLAIFGAGLVILCGVTAVEPDVSILDIFEAFGGLIRETFGDSPAVFCLICLYALISGMRTYFQITAAILFGASIVRRNKALAAVGMVLGVNFLVSTVLSIAGVSALLPRVFIVSNYGAAGSPLMGSETWLIIQNIVGALLTAFFWWFSVRIAKKSVNIE